MNRGGPLLLACAMALAAGCPRKADRSPGAAGEAARGDAGRGGLGTKPLRPPPPPRPVLAPLPDGQVYVYDHGATAARAIPQGEARAAGLLIADLSDGWAPFIFQDGGADAADPAKPNGYRQTFVDLANDRVNADGLPSADGGHNFLEPFGIPPTLNVLRARVEHDAAEAKVACDARVDVEGLRAFTGNLGYVDRERAKRDAAEAAQDAAWLEAEIARREAAAATATTALTVGGGTTGAGGSRGVTSAAEAPAPPATWKLGERAAAVAALRSDGNPKVRTRAERAARGEGRTRAVKALQALLGCDGLLSPRSRYTPGTFDLQTHEALAEWERRNDIFGWASLGGETQQALLQPPLLLDYETFRRVVAERVADAAGIVEDGTVSRGKTPATYRDSPPPTGAGGQGAAASDAPPAARMAPNLTVPNLTEDFVAALLASIGVSTPEEMMSFLRQHGPAGLARLRVAFRAPPLPPYYQTEPGRDMDLSVEIDRGDVWYDFPFDARGRPMEQPRTNYPHLTLFVKWRDQKIPLGRWRTTIGSWRSELHSNGRVYYRYKNSDVGPRVWRNIVAGPVWIPPDGTPAKDLLTRKVLDRNRGPELVVNTDVMGPGFQSAYGLVMAIHISRGGFDNQIRTHGSVDYTSIARRFSHGCHRLVNSRAVRLFDFVLRRQRFKRIGAIPLAFKRQFVVDAASYAFEIKTRGYYYELIHPLAVEVIEGRIKGKAQQPNPTYVRKAGVDYSGVDEETNPSVATPDTAATIHRVADPAPSEAP